MWVDLASALISIHFPRLWSMQYVGFHEVGCDVRWTHAVARVVDVFPIWVILLFWTNIITETKRAETSIFTVLDADRLKQTRSAGVSWTKRVKQLLEKIEIEISMKEETVSA